MKATVWIRIPILVLSAGLLLVQPPLSWGDDPEAAFEKHAKAIDSAATTPAGQERVAARLAQALNASWGLQPGPYTQASVTAQRAQNGWGWGGVLIGNRLAQAIAQATIKNDPTVTPAQALAQATAQVTTARQSMGWGAIARANGLKVGELVSSVEKTAKAVEKAEKSAEKAGKSDKADKADKAGKAEKGSDPSAAAADRGGAGTGSGGHGGGNAGGSGGAGSGGGGGGGGGGKGK